MYDRSSKILIDIISDVTEEEEESMRRKAISQKTAEITNNVIEIRCASFRRSPRSSARLRPRLRSP